MVLVDTGAAARLAGVSARSVQRAVKAMRLRNYGTDRRVLVSVDEVAEVLGDAVGIR
jgi:predicted nucleic acid-binding protein